MSPQERESRTFFYERFRAIGAGVIESFMTTFFLLIAITLLDAGKLEQALIATGGSGGLLLGPLAVYLARRSRWPVNKFMAMLHLIAAIALLFSTIFTTTMSYTLSGLIALITANMSIPLATQFYQQNYPDSRRGTLFSIASTIRVGFAALSTWLLGELITHHPENFKLVIIVTACAFAMSSYMLARCPGDSIGGLVTQRIPYSSLGLLFSDKKFAWLIAVWMFMGCGNLMMIPLRIKYLVEERYGILLNNAEAAFIVGVVPAAIVFLSTWLWGKVFDKLNFFLLRAMLNSLFLASIIIYFSSTTWTGLILGSSLLGLAMSGGNTAWSLWVTKISPPDKVADYMSVHTFMTGVRGIFAPSLAVAASAFMPMSSLVTISATLIFISLIMLGPELKTFKRRHPAQPINNQMSE